MLTTAVHPPIGNGAQFSNLDSVPSIIIIRSRGVACSPIQVCDRVVSLRCPAKAGRSETPSRDHNVTHKIEKLQMQNPTYCRSLGHKINFLQRWKRKCLAVSHNGSQTMVVYKQAYFTKHSSQTGHGSVAPLINTNNNNSLIIIIPRRYLWRCHHGVAPLREFTRFIWWMQTERQVAANPQTKPIDLGCESAGIGSLLSSASTIAILLLLSPKADTHFTVPRRVNGWVDLGTAVKVHNPCSRLYIAVAVMINTTARGEIWTWVLSHRSRTR